jgi:hypothetical protein
MAATTAFGSELLSLILTGTPIPNIADNAASSPITNWYISLHTASPGVGGNQTTNETAYTGYARIAVARDVSGWTVSSAAGDNDAQITFALCSASPGGNITHVGFGTGSSGSGSLKLFGQLTNPITMQIGSTPLFSIGELDFNCS